MWQRSQTLYLFITCVLLGGLFFSDVATMVVPEGDPVGIAYIDKLPYLVLMIVAATGHLVALFSFRKRMFQLRIAAASAVVLLGLQGWIAYDFFTADPRIIFKWTAVFPAIGTILDIMAARGIFSDELMVRSSSRLRAAKRNSK